ncbi:MAG TPA: CvpA family protein [Anaerolineae bacterium]|nr:CvpA family protein [Anaerolineae bacterium]
MVPLETLFWGLVLMFGMIGALRGWAKELLVVFSVVLARFVEFVLWQYFPIINKSLQTLAMEQPDTWFYIRALLFVLLVSFGYATTTISSALGARARKEKFQDTLLGFFLGAVNGFLVVGMLWGFLHELNYGLWNITPPASVAAMGLLEYLPISWLEGPALLVAVAIAFAFVLIVFV